MELCGKVDLGAQDVRPEGHRRPVRPPQAARPGPNQPLEDGREVGFNIFYPISRHFLLYMPSCRGVRARRAR